MLKSVLASEGAQFSAAREAVETLESFHLQAAREAGTTFSIGEAPGANLATMADGYFVSTEALRPADPGTSHTVRYTLNVVTTPSHSFPAAGFIVDNSVIAVAERSTSAVGGAAIIDASTNDPPATTQEGPIGKASADILSRAAEQSAAVDTMPRAVEVDLENLLENDAEHRAYAEAFGAESAAAFIRSARAAAGLTQAELARRMGINQSRIAELERGSGRQGVTTGLLARVALACNRKLLLTLV